MSLRLFSTSPQSVDFKNGTEYAKEVVKVAQWSDAHHFEGILVYTDNRLTDPWLVAHLILQNTERLCPLVAVQPVYAHPYAVAKLVASYAYMYGRRVYLNMVAGGFGNDLASLNDKTPHDRRYDRLVEYTGIITSLLTNEPTTFEGEFYQVKGLRLHPHFPLALFPGIMMSGSSEAGLAAARKTNSIAVKYPKPPGEETAYAEDPSLQVGVRVGIIARSTDEEAWEVAHRRFPEDRKGQLAHTLAMKVSDSVWHKQLSQIAAERAPGEKAPYWLYPFETYKTFCPYLVGAYETVGHELACYIAMGYDTFILDIPSSEAELNHTAKAFNCAKELSAKAFAS